MDLPAWQALREHYQSAMPGSFDLRAAFADDPERFRALSLQAPHVFADLSKNYLTRQTQALLTELAVQCDLPAKREAMFSGAAINQTEGRPVLHTALRRPNDELRGDLAEVASTRLAFLDFAEQVRAQPQITDIVNIGIGGSDLGPRLAVQALADFNTSGKRLHFVANIDAHELLEVLAQCRPESTLFLIASKTFTTLETMTNAQTALAWFKAQGGQDVGAHFVGITTNLQAAAALGIRSTFGFWDWVGGRFSLWSAIGLSIAISLGKAGFEAMLAGAHAMDEHFRHTPLAQNLPVQLALLDVWQRNFCGFTNRTIAPYHHGLRRLAAHLQQLEMESNGKCVDMQGQLLPVDTVGIVWGQVGSNGQHAFFQAIHQGAQTIPCEFIAVARAEHGQDAHQTQLLASALAQAQALMNGKPSPEDGHRHFAGNRPSTFILLDSLTPASFGALIALYEHRVFCAGVIWGINSFDQFGVELGKQLARDLAPRLASGDADGLDASTAGLIAKIRQAD
ncbi:MAG: glucose-6-phosphate isomerase [Brachymonas sp.]